MQKKEIKACSSNVAKVKVAVLGFCDGEINGQLSNAYDKKIYKFSSMWNMIKTMDTVFDGYTFPQASHKIRSFTGRESADGAGAELSPVVENEDGESSEKAAIHGKVNFIIHVYYRQNATWQGEILWVEGKQEQKFRSVLELQMLMDSVLEKEFNP